jgi:hypothetical protein
MALIILLLKPSLNSAVFPEGTNRSDVSCIYAMDCPKEHIMNGIVIDEYRYPDEAEALFNRLQTSPIALEELLPLRLPIASFFLLGAT